jgi:peroxiredoxin
MNADGSHNLPVPGTFIIDTKGVVRSRHVDPNWRNRMELEGVLEALRAIAKD